MDKKEAIHTGKWGERKVREYLEEKGYEILETNWRYGKKEIDIIARSPENVLVFVEVKTRNTQFEENPAFSVTRKKQKNIIMAAHHYVLQLPYEISALRFDIATWVSLQSGSELNYIEDAYYPY